MMIIKRMNVQKRTNAITYGLFVLVIGMLLVGCSGGTEGQAQYNFKQGTAEVNVKFMPNAPPQQLFPKSDFKMILELDNQAAYDVSNGNVKIVGLDPQYFSLARTEESFVRLEGRSLINPGGEKLHLEFDGTTGELFGNAERYAGNYFLKMSYNSNMEFADTVCINQNLYAVYDAGCQMNDQKSYGGQGAPLRVGSMREVVLPGDRAAVEFYLTLQNGGRGKINTVSIQKAALGGAEIDCVFSGAGADQKTVTLTKERQQTVVVCRQSLAGQQMSYTTTLAVEFAYDYEYQEQRQLQLINPAKLGNSYILG